MGYAADGKVFVKRLFHDVPMGCCPVKIQIIYTGAGMEAVKKQLNQHLARDFRQEDLSDPAGCGTFSG